MSGALAEQMSAVKSPSNTKCSCTLKWCQNKQGPFRTFEIYRSNRHTRTDAAALRESKARDVIFNRLRQNVATGTRARSRFRWHHFNPNSFEFDTRKKNDWVLKSDITQVIAAETAMSPPPAGDLAEWKTSKWVLASDKLTPKSIAERRLTSHIASPERSQTKRRRTSRARHAESDAAYERIQKARKLDAKLEVANQRSDVAKNEIRRLSHEASSAKKRAQALFVKTSNASQADARANTLSERLATLTDFTINELQSDKEKLEAELQKLREERDAALSDSIRFREERDAALSAFKQAKTEARAKAKEAKDYYAILREAVTKTSSSQVLLRWASFKSIPRFARILRFCTGVSSVPAFEEIVSAVYDFGGCHAKQRSAATAKWQSFREDKGFAKSEQGLEKKLNRFEASDSLSTPSSRSPSHRKASLLLEDKLLITLMILRLNLSQIVMGSLFDVHQSTISRTFEFGIHLLHHTFSRMFPTPLPCMLDVTCPKDVSERFGHHTVSWILDATELEIQVPDNPMAQSATWSEYKARNTAKLLIGLSACGTIAWQSAAYPGRISDPKLTERSGFYEVCAHPGQSIMADKGFVIFDELAKRKGAYLYMPPKRFKGQHTLTREEANDTRKIANFRIHVERAINRVKDYHWLTQKVPIHQVDMITAAFKVACCLVSLNGPPITAPAKK